MSLDLNFEVGAASLRGLAMCQVSGKMLEESSMEARMLQAQVHFHQSTVIGELELRRGRQSRSQRMSYK